MTFSLSMQSRTHSACWSLMLTGTLSCLAPRRGSLAARILSLVLLLSIQATRCMSSSEMAPLQASDGVPSTTVLVSYVTRCAEPSVCIETLLTFLAPLSRPDLLLPEEISTTPSFSGCSLRILKLRLESTSMNGCPQTPVPLRSLTSGATRNVLLGTGSLRPIQQTL